MTELPRNPLDSPEFGNDKTEDDLIAVLDRLRRSFEFMNGSQFQEDGSLADRIEVPSGVKVTVTIRPDQEKTFFLEAVDVAPTREGVNYNIQADDTSTEASSLPADPPIVVRNKITIEIENTLASAQLFQIFTDARLVRERRRNR